MKRQFSKDGHVTTATDPSEAVRLAYDGWREFPASVPEVEEPPAVAQPEKPTHTPRKRTSNRR